jgi:hypothetical protein
METFTSPAALKQAITTYLILHAQELPEPPRGFLAAAQAQPSPVPTIVETMEALYAFKSDLNDAARTICGQCADMVFQSSWFGKGERAYQIFKVMRRELGETQGPSASSDPEPDPTYLPAAPMVIPGEGES